MNQIFHHKYFPETGKVLTILLQNSVLHLRRRIKGLPNMITLVSFPVVDLLSKFKCHEISCKELGWIPNN